MSVSLHDLSFMKSEAHNWNEESNDKDHDRVFDDPKFYVLRRDQRYSFDQTKERDEEGSSKPFNSAVLHQGMLHRHAGISSGQLAY